MAPDAISLSICLGKSYKKLTQDEEYLGSKGTVVK